MLGEAGGSRAKERILDVPVCKLNWLGFRRAFGAGGFIKAEGDNGSEF